MPTIIFTKRKSFMSKSDSKSPTDWNRFVPYRGYACVRAREEEKIAVVESKKLML